MFEDKLWKLLQRLHKKTMEKELEWADNSDGSFVAPLGEFYVTIGTRQDPDYPNQPDYVVKILKSGVGVIEEFSNATLRGLSNGYDKSPYALFEETYTQAR